MSNSKEPTRRQGNGIRLSSNSRFIECESKELARQVFDVWQNATRKMTRNDFAGIARRFTYKLKYDEASRVIEQITDEELARFWELLRDEKLHSATALLTDVHNRISISLSKIQPK